MAKFCLSFVEQVREKEKPRGRDPPIRDLVGTYHLSISLIILLPNVERLRIVRGKELGLHRLITREACKVAF